MALEIRTPHNERLTLEIPTEVSNLSTPFNGSVCAEDGELYSIDQNIVGLLRQERNFDTIAQFSNHIPLTAEIYEDLWRKRSIGLLSGEDFSLEQERALLTEWMAPKGGEWLLDLGCSTAFYARRLQDYEPGASTVAVDFSLPMLQKARSKALNDEVDLYLMHADARELPFYSDYFDGVAMGGTLNELSTPHQVLSEIRRVLTPGGRFFIMYLQESTNWLGKLAQQSTRLGGIQFWAERDAKKLFSGCGFSVQKYETKGIVAFALLS